MSFYVGLKNTATKLLTDKGQNVSWLHDNNNGSFNPVTGVKSGGSTDRRCIMSAGNVPEVSDVVTVNSIGYQVLAVKPVNPAGTAVMYELQLRA